MGEAKRRGTHAQRKAESQHKRIERVGRLEGVPLTEAEREKRHRARLLLATVLGFAAR